MENRKEEDEVPSKTNLELIHREAKEYKLHWVTMGEAQQVKGDVKFCKEPRGQSLEIHRDAPESFPRYLRRTSN